MQWNPPIVSVQLISFIKRIYPCNYHHHWEYFKFPHSSLWPISLTPDNHRPAFVLEIHFAFSRTPHKYYRMVCTLLYLAFFQHDFEIHPCFFLLPSSVPLYGCTIVFLSIYQEDIWAVSRFWLLQVNLFWTFLYKSLCGHVLIFVPNLILWSRKQV